jgi:hypothetical protein
VIAVLYCRGFSEAALAPHVAKGFVTSGLLLDLGETPILGVVKERCEKVTDGQRQPR